MVHRELVSEKQRKKNMNYSAFEDTASLAFLESAYVGFGKGDPMSFQVPGPF